MHAVKWYSLHGSCPLLVRAYYWSHAQLVPETLVSVSLFSFTFAHILLSSSQFLNSSTMSHIQSSSRSPNFQLIFDNALKAYKKCTKNDLFKHPLADRLQTCDSPSSILGVLQEQVQDLNESQRSNTKWLDPTVNVLLTFSDAVGEGVGSVCLRTWTCLRSALSYLCWRSSHLERWSLSRLVSFSQCVPFLIPSYGSS